MSHCQYTVCKDADNRSPRVTTITAPPRNAIVPEYDESSSSEGSNDSEEESEESESISGGENNRLMGIR